MHKFGPGGAGVEVVRKGRDVYVSRHVVGAGHVAYTTGPDTKKALGVKKGHSEKVVVDTSGP